MKQISSKYFSKKKSLRMHVWSPNILYEIYVSLTPLNEGTEGSEIIKEMTSQARVWHQLYITLSSVTGVKWSQVKPVRSFIWSLQAVSGMVSPVHFHWMMRSVMSWELCNYRKYSYIPFRWTSTIDSFPALLCKYLRSDRESIKKFSVSTAGQSVWRRI